MHVYIVQYWVPFPSSEYGGVIVVQASNRAELRDLLVARDRSDVARYPAEFEAAVMGAQQVTRDTPSGILVEFTT